MLAGRAFAGTDFPGFICKASGSVLSDYQNDTLGFTPPFVGKPKMGCCLFRRAMPRPILPRREARQPQKAGSDSEPL